MSDIDMDSLVTTYNILLDYVPAANRQGAADHLMGLLVDTIDERDLQDFVSSTNCEYLKSAYDDYDFEDYADDEDEMNWDYED